MTEATPRQGKTAGHEAEGDDSRRAALAKMGRFAGYTAPAMLVLLGATKARATATGSGARHRKKSNGPRFWRGKGKKKGLLKKGLLG